MARFIFLFVFLGMFGSGCTVSTRDLAAEDSGTTNIPSTTGQNPAQTLTVANVIAQEGDIVTFNITLDQAVDEDVEITYQTVDDTAVAGTHYESLSGSLTIIAGDTEASVAVQTHYVNADAPTSFQLEILSISLDTVQLTETLFTGGINNLPRLSSCWEILGKNAALPDGVYTVDPDGVGVGVAEFAVLCDMTSNGGGWTLVDNDASTAATFTSRQMGANTDINLTRGSYLPAYAWSANPQMMVVSDSFDGDLGWVSFNALNAVAMEYPTATTQTGSHDNAWSIAVLNGNTNQGDTSFIYNGVVNGNLRFGSVWIGGGGNPTAACGYIGSRTGLGSDVDADTPTCSTWVR